MRDLVLGILRPQRLLASLPPGHEMIGRQHVEEQLAGVAFEFTENVGWEFVVGGAERRDPGRVGERSPVAQVSREAYEFPSRALADLGLLTS